MLIGSGDVQMGEEVELTNFDSEENQDLGLLPNALDRRLLVSKSILNPTGKFRVGFKRAREIFPASVFQRVQEVRLCVKVT